MEMFPSASRRVPRILMRPAELVKRAWPKVKGSSVESMRKATIASCERGSEPHT
jgi:hypothetical protein